MRRRLATTAASIVLAFIAMAPASAVGTTEIGDSCTGFNDSGDEISVVQLVLASPRPLSLTAPSGGVITSWSSNSGLSKTVAARLKVFRPTDDPKAFIAVGESAYQSIVPGPNVFTTRVPVRAGDRLGAYAPAEVGGIPYCGTANSADRLGFAPRDLSLETTGRFSEIPGGVPAVSAVIEPDRDGDGYGDETQDGCPQSAAYQGPCPTISLDTFPIVLKRSVFVLVSASEASWVQVFGQVGWRPRHKGGALASKTPKKPGSHVPPGVIVGLSGGTTMAKPGEVTPYNVKLPKSVIRHLSQIPPKQVVKGTITAQTTDLAGRAAERTITIRLHGRGPVHSAGTP